MKKPVRRGTEEILLEIKEKAKIYTPEWHPIEKQPDIGVALSEVFARMQSDTEKKYEKLTEKYCVDYFNCLEANVKPASPAEGYVVFKMAGEDVPPEPLNAGAVLVTDAADEDGEPVQAEITEDIMVVPQSIKAIVETEGRSDYVGIVYDADNPPEDETDSRYVFFGGEADNIQSHMFFLAHPNLFPLGESGIIDISFIYRNGEFVPSSILKDLVNPDVCTVFYEVADGIELFKNVSATQHGIRIVIDSNVSDWIETEKDGHLSRWLGFAVHKTFNLESFGFEDVFIRSECALEKPDVIFSDNISEQGGFYLPFGERFQIYDDLYFGSDDALSKKGAEIELSFCQEFRSFPLVEEDDDKSTNWKLIMSVDDFKVEKTYDISIEEVIWEYYNGNGWAKLFPGKKNADVFGIKNGIARRMLSLSFVCPDDISPVMIETGEGYFIRARIRKINNEYKTAGQYVTPMISDVCFGYHYNEKQVRPEKIFITNNVETELCSDIGTGGHIVNPVVFPEEKERCLYIGLDGRLDYGPVKILFVLNKRMEEEQPKFVIEYYTKNGQWKMIKAVDETLCMKTTGIITLTALPDSRRRNMYGFDLYWIRLRKTFPDKVSRVHPVITHMYINATRARTLRTDTREVFTIEQYAQERTIRLKNKNIQDEQVWIREDSGVTAAERKKLIEAGRYRVTEDAYGEPVAYVRWRQTDNSLDLETRKQLYMLDAGKGILTFGKGSAGLLPAPEVQDSIIVEYSFGGGSICNLRAGGVKSLDLSRGFISEVTNPMDFSGGFDKESKEDALLRAKREQKHSFHAITLDDYEALAFEASRNIAKVRCFGGMDINGNREPGNVTLVIMLKDYENQKSFDDQKHQLMSFMRDKLPVGMKADGNFRIREPELVKIYADIEAEIEDYRDTLPVIKILQDRLDDFINPLTGGFSGKGWNIGTIPDTGQIETIVRGAKGIVALNKCKLSARIINSPNSITEDIVAIQEKKFILPCRGEYRIQLIEQKRRR